MSELILHHYEGSPYCEKVRVLFGRKNLAWHGIDIPVVMPKPDYLPLTGGYRRTPSLQVGADVYCDTQLIAAEIERRRPEPSLYADSEGLDTALAQWGEAGMFYPAALFYIGLYADKFPMEFHRDRAAMRGGRADLERTKAQAAPRLAQLRPHLAWLEDMLGDGRPYLLGERPGLGDLACYHPLWFLGRGRKTAAELEPYARLRAWLERLAAIGHGEHAEMTATEALDRARDSEPEPVVDPGGGFTPGAALGDRVAVGCEDRVPEPVVGELVIDRLNEIAVRRSDPRVGKVVVHFPRLGYVVSAV